MARYRHAQVSPSVIAAGAALVVVLMTSACGGGSGGVVGVGRGPVVGEGGEDHAPGVRDDARNPVGQNDVAIPPPLASLTVPISRGRALIPIPQAGDGDAFYATVTAPRVDRRR
jgi:hypothetical protein